MAIVAMLTATSEDDRRPSTPEPNTYTIILANPLGAMLLDQYYRGQVNKGWFLESWEPGLIRAGFQYKAHYLSVLIETKASPIRLSIAETHNLNQSDMRIHKKGKLWLDDLDVNVRDALGKAQLAKRRLAVKP